MSFDQIVQTQAYSLNNGALFLDDTNETSLADPLALGTAAAALVFDTSNFGATSPVAGPALSSGGRANVRVDQLHQRAG